MYIVIIDFFFSDQKYLIFPTEKNYTKYSLSKLQL